MHLNKTFFHISFECKKTYFESTKISTKYNVYMFECFNKITLNVLISLKVRNVQIFRMHNISSKIISQNEYTKYIYWSKSDVINYKTGICYQSHLINNNAILITFFLKNTNL